LQVWLGRGEAACRRGRKRVACVNAARVVDVYRQCVRVGGLELGELPPLQHRIDEAPGVFWQLLVGCEVVEKSGPRLPLSALGALAAGQLQLVEQQLAELPG